ncbi:MAG: ABC transporter ATP-binding protein [Flavobacteriaceae bacterium]|jgi:ATP-binding cassette, subfamily B, multidrug efflux pump|nr:ABC transporter ATP-binding protein [Flavobacteriaceae bacterium]MBT4112980.1 ABC transporter ATP-binding protein [Flavobacteriaceae bacterium]MBT4614601.1 ABC transporter ATP-binding protein [Flavobacteriaceae bacterium]MBT5246210.1 ABC transporter ATP-binding protein [Flavobacteriaceae bacterium]MBT5650505.1 ABC transporter ATP-binding protein [Flavobacteriaceae bacterium]
MKEKTKVYNVALFKRLLYYIYPYKLFFSVCIFSVLGISIFGALRPVVLEKIVDQNLTAQISDGFLYYIVLIGILLICEVISNYLFIYYASWLGQSVVKDIRVKLFNHILNFKMKYYDKSSVGILITRAVTDMERIADIFGQGLFMILSDILKMLIVGIVMTIMNWKLSLIVFSTLPLILIATKIFQKYMKMAFDQVRTEVANLNSFVQERVTGMKVLQLFAREEIEYLKFKEINERHKKAWLKTVWYNSIFFPVAEILSSLTLGVVVWYGGMNNILDNSTSLGELTAFIMMIPMMFRPLNQIANKFNTLLMGMVAAERVFKVIDTDSNINESGNKIANNLKGDIQFKNINFSYNESETVLKNISFEIKAGTTTAIVGSTGAGKSTIINLINRFYEINSGDILIDGINIKEFTLSSLRDQIGFVSQDVHLFSDTILHNITLNNSNISFDQVKRASTEIGVHDFIITLPNGYNYNVRERGIMLSTGQRQLISFLRAYITNPRILILDEATSSIDTDSEILIQKAIEKMTDDRTSLVIAHRLSTIRNADNIIVMNLGEIVEQGTHEELLKIKGYYKKLYDTQLKSQKIMELS